MKSWHVEASVPHTTHVNTVGFNSLQPSPMNSFSRQKEREREKRAVTCQCSKYSANVNIKHLIGLKWFVAGIPVDHSSCLQCSEFVWVRRRKNNRNNNNNVKNERLHIILLETGLTFQLPAIFVWLNRRTLAGAIWQMMTNSIKHKEHLQKTEAYFQPVTQITGEKMKEKTFSLAAKSEKLSGVLFFSSHKASIFHLSFTLSFARSRDFGIFFAIIMLPLRSRIFKITPATSLQLLFNFSVHRRNVPKATAVSFNFNKNWCWITNSKSYLHDSVVGMAMDLAPIICIWS